VSFYQAAFGATTLHRVGDGDDIVVRLEVGDARFWIAPARSELGRLSPNQIGGRTSRTLLIVDDPDAMVKQAIEAGSTEDAPVGEEHGWRVGRIVDPYGHEWEIGKPLGE
jgi:PhnB protein